MHKEYTVINKLVKIRDENGVLHERSYVTNLEKILLMENRYEVLKEAQRQENKILESLKLDINTSFFLKKISLKRRKRGSKATMKLIHYELSVTEEKLERLEDTSNEDMEPAIQKETIEVEEDNDYMFNLIDRLETIANLGENRKKLVKMSKKGTLDTYLDKIGCRDEDKDIFKELLGIHTSSYKQPIVLGKK